MSPNYGVWLSLVERYVRDVEVAGSNPVTPTFEKRILSDKDSFLLQAEIFLRACRMKAEEIRKRAAAGQTAEENGKGDQICHGKQQL